MSEAVRVDLREATMTESARLRERGDQLFLVMETPPPVRSLLRLTVADERKAFEVARVVEVVEEGEPERGCYGRWVDVARLAEQDRVGSEHLEPGISGAGGVPAPVVIMNTSEMMLGDAADDDEVVLTRSERFAGAEDGATPTEVTQPAAAPASESSESSEAGEAGEAATTSEHE
jgi:hypothetical protein